MTVRAFYAALGVELPAWSNREAPVRCFAQPDAHNRGDRSPSCSVNLASGAWNCHGCGAHGGAYDAALAVGHTPRSAMELLIAHELAEPRPSEPRSPRQARISVRQPDSPAPARRQNTMDLLADERDVQRWAEMLDANSRLIRQLALQRAWGTRVIQELEIGFDGARITIPIRDPHNDLRGVLRYDPFGRRDPKLLAVPGTRLGLIPHPARETSDRIILVEGPPDMMAARSCGLPAIAISGTNAWRPSWAQLLTGRRVTVVMDCDTPGRRAADEIAKSLQAAAIPTDVIDLWPDRGDGYDLTDRILERRRTRTDPRAARTIASLLRPRPILPSQPNAGTCPQHPGGSTMTEIAGTGNGDYTTAAHRAILEAVRDQHDFGGWLAGVLASVSADLGSTEALTAGRPGSWEAAHVRGLVNGTIGWGDEYLDSYGKPLP